MTKKKTGLFILSFATLSDNDNVYFWTSKHEVWVMRNVGLQHFIDILSLTTSTLSWIQSSSAYYDWTKFWQWKYSFSDFISQPYTAQDHLDWENFLAKFSEQDKKIQVKQPRCAISFVNPFHFVFIEDSWRPAMKILLCSTAFDAGGRQTDTRIHNEKPKLPFVNFASNV